VATLADLLRLARPAHWIKNAFVLLPVPFALAAGAKLQPWPLVWGLLGFCLVNSAVYTLNDLCDAAADRLHPRKSRRPIAAGAVTAPVALLQAGALFLAGIGLCLAAARPHVMVIVSVYVAVNLAYTLGAKHVALLDVFLLSSGFVLRVLLGCALLRAAPSSWLLLCTSCLALFLGFAKRRADLHAGLNHEHRPSLRGYSVGFLDQATAVCAAIAILSYALYCIDSGAFLKEREMASMPFVAYGILNYLRLATTKNLGGSPVEVAYSSPSTQLCVLGWLVSVFWSFKISVW
jgi:4-hydroxybenzoate polyprenyltransferase